VRSAGEVLSSLFEKQFGPEFLDRARFYADFFSSWDSITTGAGIASAGAHSRIANLEKGLLIIEVDHPGWKQILQTKQGELLDLARKRYPQLGIRGIAFWVSREIGTLNKSGGREEGPAESSPPEEEQAGKEQAEEKGRPAPGGCIHDEKLRASLQELEKAFRARKRAG